MFRRPSFRSGLLAALAGADAGAVALLAISIGFAAVSAFYAWGGRIIVPIYDQWDFHAWYRQVLAHGLTLEALLEPHNGHYLPLPRLFFLARYLWTAGSPGLLVAMTLALQAGLVLVLLSVLWREAVFIGDSMRAALAAATIVLLTWTVQFENFHWGLQIIFVVAILLALASLLVMTAAAAERRPLPALALASVACLIGLAACATLGSGLALWPTLLVVVLLARGRRVLVLPLILAAALSALPYLLLPTDTSDGTFAALAQPGEMLGYMARYLGPPVASDDVRSLFGGLLLLPGVWAVARGLLRGETNRFAAFHIALVAFGLAVAFLTALARVKAGIGTAGGSRYAAFSMLYWVGLLSLAGFYLVQARRATAKATLYGAGAATFLLLILPTESVLIAPFVQKADRSAAAVLSVVTGVPDRDLIGRYLHPRIDKVATLVPVLRDRKFGFFGSDLVQSLGHPARQSYPVQAAECPAALAAAPLDGGVRVTGRFAGGGAPDELVLVDQREIVVGLGITNRRGGEFTLYAPVPTGTVYGVRDDGLCRAGVLG